MDTIIKAGAIGWYVAMLVIPVLAIADILPQFLIGLPMGCLGVHALKEIGIWVRQ